MSLPALQLPLLPVPPQGQREHHGLHRRPRLQGHGRLRSGHDPRQFHLAHRRPPGGLRLRGASLPGGHEEHVRRELPREVCGHVELVGQVLQGPHVELRLRVLAQGGPQEALRRARGGPGGEGQVLLPRALRRREALGLRVVQGLAGQRGGRRASRAGVGGRLLPRQGGPGHRPLGGPREGRRKPVEAARRPGRVPEGRGGIPGKEGLALPWRRRRRDVRVVRHHALSHACTRTRSHTRAHARVRAGRVARSLARLTVSCVDSATAPFLYT
mmetsp:Transcript_1201/g.4100  ORF Transcript_1201/g.4100 Transcript_1201/m.4100 type:complete len:271 (+) Transcript_1201:692-1504(+)